MLPTKMGGLAPAFACLSLLAGCASFSGLGGVTAYGCQAPRGSSCASLSAVYAGLAAQPATGEPATSPVADSALPPHSAPRRLRIWLAPWVDQEGSLHDQSFLYVQLDNGRWLLDAQRELAAGTVLQRLKKLSDQPAVPAGALPSLPGVQRAADAGAQR